MVEKFHHSAEALRDIAAGIDETQSTLIQEIIHDGIQPMI